MAEVRDDILKVNEKAQDLLLEYTKSCVSIRDEGWQLRNRLENIDRAYMREADWTEEQRKARLANTQGNAAKLQNMQVPTVMESVENSVAFLSNVFLTEYPVFRFGGEPEGQDKALQWNTLVGSDQIHYGWAGEFNKAFRNGAKYNFAPIEVEWKKEIKYKPKTGNGPNGVVLEQVIWEGNCIKSLDPYNTVYDPRVPIHKVHEDGEFVGYIDAMSRIQLKRFLASLGDSRLKNDRLAFESPAWEIAYWTPYINPDVIIRNKNWADGSFNWVNWATGEAQNHVNYQNMYTVVKLYARIMPYEFGIRSPRDQTPDVWKIVCVNGVIVYAQPLVSAHDYLPIVIAQPLVDNLDHQTKSQAENQIPFQQMVSALWNAKLQSARRRVTDRMLYNPLLVDPDHINSPNPTAKIPIRPTAYGRKLEEAIYQIPFHDENSQYWIQEANGVAEWGMRADGQNKVSLGQFQKGNKLQDEFNTVMANAGSRQRTQAIMWEVFAFQPIKSQLKSNYLLQAPAGARYNHAEQQVVQINPEELRKTESEFEIGDGLLPIQKLLHTDMMSTAFQTIAAVPGIQAGYNLPPMFSYMMKVSGADKLSKFEKSPEQQQYEQALGAWNNAAANIVPELIKQQKSPEDVAKYIGPMPTPPQPKPTQNPTKGTGNAKPTP